MSPVQPRILNTPNHPPAALLRYGPVLPVTITVTQKDAAIRGERPEIIVIGLVDTGASRTAISTRVADALQLEKVDECQIVGPHGEPQTCNLHFVDFTFTGSLVNFTRWPVTETDLKGPPSVDGKPLDMLIGRDVLTKAEFIYDGARAGFRLEVPSPSDPDHPAHPNNNPSGRAIVTHSIRPISKMDKGRKKGKAKMARSSRKKNR